MAASCPSNAGSLGLLSRWRAVTKALSGSDRTGIVGRIGPVIEISKEALMQCEEKNLAPEVSKDFIRIGKTVSGCQFTLCKSLELSNSTA